MYVVYSIDYNFFDWIGKCGGYCLEKTFAYLEKRPDCTLRFIFPQSKQQSWVICRNFCYVMLLLLDKIIENIHKPRPTVAVSMEELKHEKRQSNGTIFSLFHSRNYARNIQRRHGRHAKENVYVANLNWSERMK